MRRAMELAAEIMAVLALCLEHSNNLWVIMDACLEGKWEIAVDLLHHNRRIVGDET